MASPPDKALPEEVLAALQSGKWIEAIKLLRGASGAGLKQTREMIDVHRAGEVHRPAATVNPPPPPLYHEGLSPGEVPRSEDFGRTVVIVLVAALLAYLYFTR